MGGGVSAHAASDWNGADELRKALDKALQLRDCLERSSTVGLSGEIESLLLNRDVLRAGGKRMDAGNAYSPKLRRPMSSRLRSSRVLEEALSETHSGRALYGDEEMPLKRVAGLGDGAAMALAPRCETGHVVVGEAVLAHEEHAGALCGGEATSMQIFVGDEGKTITLDVEPTDTVDAVQQKVHGKTGVLPDQQRLGAGRQAPPGRVGRARAGAAGPSAARVAALVAALGAAGI